MSSQPIDEETLFREAMDLVIRLQEDPNNAVAHSLVNSWRSRSAAHEQMWEEASRLHILAGKAVVSRRKQVSFQRSVVSRRKLMLGGAGLAAAAAGAIYVPSAVLKARADYLTETAQLKQISLPDGTTATLGPDSAIKVDFSNHRRRVELLSGMAYFEVVDDQNRPFLAQRGDLIASGNEIVFDFREDAGLFTVSISRGIVDIITPSAPSLDLEQGEWIRFDSETFGLERGRMDASRVASWRDALIVADGEKISALISQIERWHNGKIVVASTSLNNQRVSGLFDLKKPIDALRAVVGPYGGKIRQVSPWLTIVSTV